MNKAQMLFILIIDQVCYEEVCKIQMNQFADFENSHIIATEDGLLELQSKIKRCRSFEKWVQAIYEHKTNIKQLYLISEEIQMDSSMGEMYTIVRDRLQNVCKIHKRLVMNSFEDIWEDRNAICKVDREEEDENNEYLDEEESILLVKEAIVLVIYQHYCNISSANKQICYLWDNLSPNFDETAFNFCQTNRFELKQNILNQFTLKELIPTSHHLWLHNFREILEELLDSPFVNKKEHISKMYEVLTNKSEKTVIQQFRKKTMKIRMEFQSSQTWFSRIRQNKIANKLISRIGVDYNEFESDEIFSFNEEINEEVSELHNSLIPKTLQDLDLDPFNFKKTNSMQTGPEQSKKKKNKKKKKKKNEEEKKNRLQNLLGKKKVEQEEGLEKQISTTMSTCEVKQQYEITIKMFENMVIDDSKRSRCKISDSYFQKWFKRIRNQYL